MAVVSSCREVLVTRNERNPTLSCHPQGGTLRGLLQITERKVMTSRQHGLYVQGCYQCVTMHGTNCCEPVRGS